ncbi:MAG: hypothetical protein N2442_02455 [Spirochaetes bacterium]|nr:hypothetical protein [Spirochaetota bacterium]
MPQIYILSILICLLTGGVFAADMLEQKAQVLAFLKRLQEKGSQTLLGIVVFIFGIIKLFILSPTETTLVLGDLLPALVGILGGGILTIEALYRDRDIIPPFMSKVMKVRKQYASGLGILFIFIGLLHLILPGVILL